MKYLKLLFLIFPLSIFAQNPSTVDFKTISANIEINPVKRNVVGSAVYTFELSDKKIDTIRVDAVTMVFSDVRLNNKKVEYKVSKKQLLLYDGFKKGSNELTFHYEAFPTQAMYFVNWDFTQPNPKPADVDGQIWTQGQGKYTSNWLPSFDDVNEKTIFNLTFKFEKSFTVISNGIMAKQTTDGENSIWNYQMSQPMSSYLVMVAIGHFDKEIKKSESGIVIENYFEPSDSLKVPFTYKYSDRIFNNLEKEIGVPYPWKIYRQIPVRDFLYAGMENTSSTVFSHDFVVDKIAFNDRNYINISAHELAHQWFGDMVTAKSGKDHWLQEGFATYYALLAEREIFGDDYFYLKLFNTSQQIKEASKTDRVPILDPKASSLTFYQKGAWALHVLRDKIGAENFRKAVQVYLSKNAFRNVETSVFLNEIAVVAPTFDIQNFKKTWLESAQFPQKDIDEALAKNEFITKYIKVFNKPLSVILDREEIMNILTGKDYYAIKELVVFQTTSQPFTDKEYILKSAMHTKLLPLRQAVAVSLGTIPESFRTEYETLMDDDSYETQEIALFNLWRDFPDRAPDYLIKYRDRNGFNNKNLRLLFLSMVYTTSADPSEKLQAFRELLSYTGTNHDSGLQQNALEKLITLKLVTPEVLRSLVYGMGSHRWQFAKYSKDNLKELAQNQTNMIALKGMLPTLPVREKALLTRFFADLRKG